MATRLSKREVIELRDLLIAAFEPDRFEDFLMGRLDRRTDDYAGQADSYPTRVRRVVLESNSKLWWRQLVREGRNAVPEDPDLMAFGERFGISPETLAVDAVAATPLTGSALEAQIRAAGSTYELGPWRARLGRIEGCVCRIEYPAAVAIGTGFLVGPRAVLTNHHVVEPIQKGDVPAEAVVLRFDHKVDAGGVATQAGTPYALADDWLADWSPMSPCDLEFDPVDDPAPTELDYALLLVEGAPGEDPVGGPSGEEEPTLRRCIELPRVPYDFVAQRALYIVQHPDGKPLQVALDTEAVIDVNAGRTRVRYRTTTAGGSSGSPCFGPDWQCVALHHGHDPVYAIGQAPRFNRGIPLTTIRALIATRHRDQFLCSSSA